ncbi:SsrA-binding protein SmpB [Rhodobacteraceae bacterium 2CG4]|uniref:SsrA-binding protein n=1 Tax=Halovulum marinum TaxID=2662447 RepID=A0A6L5Z555_9RHOB|nr:SsrA-binding protein SmpB [Halovulum marinum]MSU91653.1 SsrA-binding protein SmpB [Halovulum marinum]
MARTPASNSRTIAENRKARYNYAIEDDIEVGIMLQGSEVKSLRAGNAQIAESYAEVKDGELWLVNAYIEGYDKAKTFGHDERRRRKLLASRREIARMHQNVGREGMTLVPLSLYFNGRGIAKLKLGLAKGKKVADKRETEKKRDWNRQKQRLLKAHG